MEPEPRRVKIRPGVLKFWWFLVPLMAFVVVKNLFVLNEMCAAPDPREDSLDIYDGLDTEPSSSRGRNIWNRPSHRSA